MIALLLIICCSRATITLNGDRWKFVPGSVPEDKWMDIRVPSTWKNHEFNFNIYNKFAGENYKYNYANWYIKYNEGWYKIKFPTPKIIEDSHRVILEIRRANFISEFFLNGKEIGKHKNPFVPFRCDITNKIKETKNNLLMVHIMDGNYADFDINETHSMLKYYIKRLGGLEGDVFLKLVPSVRVEKVLIDTYIKKEKIQIRYYIKNCTDTLQEITLKPQILTPKDSVAICFDSKNLIIPPHSEFIDTLTQNWTNPIQWGFGKYGTPYLYKINLQLIVEDKIIDNFYETFGFREFTAEKNHFYLNGNEIFLYGDNPGSGICFLGVLNRFWARYMIKAERDANINYIRTHTFIPPESWMEECDRMGMFLEPEFVISRDDAFMQYEKKNVKEIIKEYYNHPSIVIWSIDNESVSKNRVIDREILEKHIDMSNIVRSIDPCRLIDHQGDEYLGIAYKWGLNFYPQIFNMHPGIHPVKETILKFKSKFNYHDSVPLLIGEIYSHKPKNWINKIKEHIKSNDYSWNNYSELAEHFYTSAIAAQSVGAAGVAPHSTLARGYWGALSKDSFVTGPFNFTNIDSTFKEVEWPAFSGEGPKIDNMYLWSWHSSQFNWFEESRPSYTPNIVHKKVKEAYGKITQYNFPPIDIIEEQNIIITVPDGTDYVYIKPKKLRNQLIKGVLVDNNNKGWFKITEKGQYITWYNCKGTKIEKEINIKNIKKKIKPGYDVLLLDSL